MIKEKENPKVSILIPLYNQERYFKACIKSVEKQTYKNLEIIIVNDGSKDRSPQMAQDWATRDNRVVLINKKNEGLTMARYDAYKKATGDFIFILDSDDYIPNNAIELLVGHMTSKNVDVVIGSMTQVLGFIKRSHYTDTGSFPFHEVIKQSDLFPKYYLNFFGKHYFSIMLCGNLFRKSIIDKAMRYTRLCCDEIPFVGEDHYAFMKLFPFVRSMYRTNETTYYYRCGGASSDHFSPTYPSLFFFSDERVKLLDKYGLQEEGILPLFKEYATVVFYHVKQLLEYKQADKDGVMEFLKDELSKRHIVKRLKDYLSKHEESDQRLLLIKNDDYEGIYSHVMDEMAKVSFKHKCKKWALRLMNV